MTTLETQPDALPINARADHHCFGCGDLNPYGLRLRFFPLPDGAEVGVWADWTPEPVHEGYVGMVHGGIITTVLDEAMSWAAFGRGRWAVTGRLSVAFRRPVPVGQPTVVTGRIARDRGRVLEITATLRDRDTDTVHAESTGTFVHVPDAQADEWRRRYATSDT